MSKYSSFKEHQLITENWRKFLAEDTDSLNPAAAAEGAKTPKAQELADIAEEDPEVQAALAAVMDELAPAEGLNEMDPDVHPDYVPIGYTGAAIGANLAIAPVAAIEAAAGTPALAALLDALNVSLGTLAASSMLGAGALGVVAAALIIRKLNKPSK